MFPRLRVLLRGPASEAAPLPSADLSLHSQQVTGDTIPPLYILEPPQIPAGRCPGLGRGLVRQQVSAPVTPPGRHATGQVTELDITPLTHLRFRAGNEPS